MYGDGTVAATASAVTINKATKASVKKMMFIWLAVK